MLQKDFKPATELFGQISKDPSITCSSLWKFRSIIHMPDQHKDYLTFTSEHFLTWSKAIGTHTQTTVQGFLDSHKVKKQALKSCLALSKLPDRYSVERLESACMRALSYSPSPNIKSITAILRTGQDKQRHKSLIQRNTNKQQKSHGFIRGAAYYGRKMTNDNTLSKLNDMRLRVYV